MRGIFAGPAFLFGHPVIETFVALGALEFRNIAKIDRVLKRSIAFVARGALPCIPISQVHGMLENTFRRREGGPLKRLIERGMSGRTVAPYHFSFGTLVLSVVTSETALGVKMANVVDVGTPVSFHFREEIRLIYPL